jgi:hypothetical protein
VEVLEFRAPGRAIADRLDMTGVNVDAIHDFLNQQFSYVDDYANSPEYFAVFSANIQAEIREGRAYELAMSAEAWVRGLASSADDSDQPDPSKLGSRTWLLRQLDDWDERFALRRRPVERSTYRALYHTMKSFKNGSRKVWPVVELGNGKRVSGKPIEIPEHEVNPGK